MKKILKIIGIVIGVIVLLGIVMGFYINSKGIPYYENKAPEITVTVDSARIARGAKLATLVCAGCHKSYESTKFEGRWMDDIDPAFGKIYIPNITKGAPKGVDTYTDGELVYLLRTGIKKNGQYAPPWMVKFPHMADEELYDLIAFLRSDNPSLEHSDKVDQPIEPSFLALALSNFVFKPFPMPEQEIVKPSPSDKIAFGEYTANAVHQCYSCHSESFTTIDELNPEKSVGFYGGGNPMLDPDGQPIFSANITMDLQTGIGNYSEADFIKAVKWGSRPDNTPIMMPMPKFTLLDDEEVAAIYAYLKTVPIIVNDVKSASKPKS